MIRTAFLLVYRLAWVLILPLLLVYLKRRAKKAPVYGQHLAERFGRYAAPLPQNAVWLHAVSLGETRSAIGLIRLLLDRGEKVVITNFTPTGRAEAQRQFAQDIAEGRLAVVWVPFDMMWTYARFFRACRPKIGLTLEVEVWPAMIFAARRAGVPLFMCNGQYASRPLARDSRGLRIRQRVMRGLAGAFVKSNLQAERFAQVGITNVTVTGELRFDQPIPMHQVEAAEALRSGPLADWGDVIAIASGVEDEEALYLRLIQDVRARAVEEGRKPPVFVYVPRAPERFDAVAEGLSAAGINTARRSDSLDDAFSPVVDVADAAVLLGDSLGEMFFYLSLADRVIVGGGFTERGAHNIIEPLMRGKPVLVGPSVWTIEYPFVEAEAAGVARIAQNGTKLAEVLAQPAGDMAARIDAFLAVHAGASARTIEAIDAALGRSGD